MTDLTIWKTAGGGLIGMAGSTVGWAFAAAEADGTLEFAIPAAALTATASAFVWLVKLMASGTLVHRDQETAMEKLAEALERSNQIAQEAMNREDRLYEFVTRYNQQGD